MNAPRFTVHSTRGMAGEMYWYIFDAHGFRAMEGYFARHYDAVARVAVLNQAAR